MAVEQSEVWQTHDIGHVELLQAPSITQSHWIRGY
jgi:hypothetical protein